MKKLTYLTMLAVITVASAATLAPISANAIEVGKVGQVGGQNQHTGPSDNTATIGHCYYWDMYVDGKLAQPTPGVQFAVQQTSKVTWKNAVLAIPQQISQAACLKRVGATMGK